MVSFTECDKGIQKENAGALLQLRGLLRSEQARDVLQTSNCFFYMAASKIEYKD